MRIITRSKIYRAFPALDDFSDERCEGLIQRLRAGVTYPATAFFAAAVTLAVMLAMTYALFNVLHAICVGLIGRWSRELAPLAISLALTMGLPALAALLVRDFVLWRFLHRAITRRIDLTRCRGCKYLLLGQNVIDGFITCPECGRPTTLAELGLNSPADLIPPDGDHEPLPEELSPSN